MKKYTEGILTDLFDLLTQVPEFPKNSATQVLENYLDPYSVDDLWNGVIYKLRQINNNSVKKVMTVFFPENGKPDLNSIEEIPNNVDPQLIKLFRYQFENVIIEFITKDAMDIIDQVQKFLKNNDPNYDVSQITGQQYLGSIMKQVTSNKYDIINKLKSTWTKFKNEANKEKWQNSSEDAYTNIDYDQGVKSSDASKMFDNFAKRVKSNYPNLSDEQILDNLKFLLSNDNYLIKAVGGMKTGGAD